MHLSGLLCVLQGISGVKTCAGSLASLFRMNWAPQGSTARQMTGGSKVLHFSMRTLEAGGI